MSKIHHAGLPLDRAKKAAILIHGRGASADSILSLRSVFKLDSYAVLAPEAIQKSWYPFSFMAPDQQNQAALQNSLEISSKFGISLSMQGFHPKTFS